MAMMVTTSVLNRSARSQQVSPDFTVYSNGPDGVRVIVGSGVLVMVGVLDGVGVGSVAVAVAVLVGVGVRVENKAGAFGPANQAIRIMIPITSNKTAKPPIKKGSMR